MAYKIDEVFPFKGINFTGETYQLKEKKADNMGMLYNGIWKHFVKIVDNTYWATTVHYSTNNALPTLCGRDNNSVFLHYTNNKNIVDCKHCIKKMK